MPSTQFKNHSEIHVIKIKNTYLFNRTTKLADKYGEYRTQFLMK